MSDLDGGSWIERFTAPDHSLAPLGHELVQAHTDLAPGEPLEKGVRRLESVLDGAFPGWREPPLARWRDDEQAVSPPAGSPISPAPRLQSVMNHWCMPNRKPYPSDVSDEGIENCGGRTKPTHGVCGDV